METFCFYVICYVCICVGFVGGPKLRKWYGAPDLLPKDGSEDKAEDDYPGNLEAMDVYV